MAITKDREASFEKLDDLKTLLAGKRPCLSVYFTLSKDSTAGANPKGKQNELRWRECLETAEQQASQFGEAGQEVLAAIRSWDAVAPEEVSGGQTQQGKSIAVFRSPDVFQVTWLDEEVEDRSVFGRQFYIRPLIKELVRTRSFYLLALSRKNTRLLHCTMHTSEELPFAEGFKTDFEDWLDQAKPDHRAVNNAMAAGRQGSVGPSALAPKGSPMEDTNEFLLHFCKHIAAGVGQTLKGRTEPLVLCAVEYEVPIYREVNIYPHLVPESVHGAPNGLKSGEMHARAIEALNRSYDRKVDESLAEWNHKVGGGGSSHLKEVVTAAHDGRVLTLLVSDSQEPTGYFDEATNSVKAHGAEADKEDLVNDAVVQTILHAGKVLVASAKKMPHGVPAAAIFRF